MWDFHNSISSKPGPNNLSYHAGGSYRNWKKRYFVLSNSSLQYFAKEGDQTPKGTIDLTQGRGIRTKDQCELESWPKEAKPGLAFGLAIEGRTYYIYGNDRTAIEYVEVVTTKIIINVMCIKLMCRYFYLVKGVIPMHTMLVEGVEAL